MKIVFQIRRIWGEKKQMNTFSMAKVLSRQTKNVSFLELLNGALGLSKARPALKSTVAPTSCFQQHKKREQYSSADRVLIECMPPWALSLAPGMVVCTSKPNTPKVKAQGQQCKFTLGHTVNALPSWATGGPA